MGTPCTTNLTNFTDVVATGVIIQEYHVNQLRAAINNELARRSISNTTPGSDLSAGNIVSKSNVALLMSNIAKISAVSWTSDIATSGIVSATHINELRSKINSFEDDCICDCNYCACNCNYCTCDCNHACTCNCNYATSDIRLKTNIVYF